MPDAPLTDQRLPGTPAAPTQIQNDLEQLWGLADYPLLLAKMLQLRVLGNLRTRSMTLIYAEDQTHNRRANALDVAVHERLHRDTTDTLRDDATQLCAHLAEVANLTPDRVRAGACHDLDYLLSHSS